MLDDFESLIKVDNHAKGRWTIMVAEEREREREREITTVVTAVVGAQHLLSVKVHYSGGACAGSLDKENRIPKVN